VPTADEFWLLAAQVVSERGYLVIGFIEGAAQPELGSTLDNVLGFKPQQRLTAVGLTDWKDWKEQMETFYFLRPDWGRGQGGHPNGTYYRVKFYAEGTPFLPRAIARIADYVLLNYGARYIAGSLFVFLLAMAAGGRPPLWILLRISHHRLPLFIASVLGYFAYQTICTSVHGSTLGKLLLSLQVLQDDGSLCRPLSAVIRELSYFVDSIFFGLIGYMAIQRNQQQKRHGDSWAHTIVCKYANVPQESKQGALRFVLGLMVGIMADVAVLMLGFLITMNY
jgi:uncharacterized RDD family membrane protein YckC